MTEQKRHITTDIPKNNNFDFVRFLLAMTVLCNHYIEMSGINGIHLPISSATAVGGFFVISGFLIFRSYLRTSTFKTYMEKRIRRIVPAYMSIVLLCAGLLSLTSTLSCSDYFLSSEVYKYLASNATFMNFLHPTLPGVFEENRISAINPALWTIKIELFLYLLIPVISFSLHKHKMAFSVLAFLGIIIASKTIEGQGGGIFMILAKDIYQTAFFLIGILSLTYFDFLFKYKYVLLAATLPLLLLKGSGLFPFAFPIIVGIWIFFIAFTFPVFNSFGRYGDLSYGIYLFHCPIIQIFIYLKIGDATTNFALALLTTLLLAFLSWHLLEKKMLIRA